MFCCALILSLSPLSVWGASSSEILILDPIHVSAPRLDRDWMSTAQAVSVVDVDDIQKARQNLQLDEALNRIPGVFTQNRYNFAQNLRIAIRGFGARAPFGVRGIRIYVDGIPETLPDGQSQLDAIDLESTNRIEVIRGPASALYGNATGGVIAVRTMDGLDPGGIELRSVLGADGLQRVGLRGGGQRADWNAHISVWDLQYDGYREHSRTAKRLLNAKLRHDLDSQRSWTGVLTLLDQPLGQDAGGLTRGEVERDRRAANPLSLRLNAGQQVRQERLGFVYRDERFAGGGTLRTRAFFTRREFVQQLPFPGSSRPQFDRHFFGLGVDFSQVMEIGAVPAVYQMGIEFDQQRDDRTRRNVSPAGIVGGLSQNEIQNASSLGVFSQINLDWSDRLIWTLVTRLDRIHLSIDDRLGAEINSSGERNFSEPSVSTGFNYEFGDRVAIYGTLGTAFETPTFTEFAQIDAGGFNPALGPQRAINTELGIKGALGTDLYFDLAVFSVRTRDEIVNIQTDQNAFANAGRTRRDGVEFGLHYNLSESTALSLAYTWSDFVFRDFEVTDGLSLAGNRLPGLPQHAVFAEISWRGGDGWFAKTDWLAVGEVFADNANENLVDSYAVVNARIGRELGSGRYSMGGFVAVNNLLNHEYFSNIRINAAGGRYFEPAPGRNVFAGLQLRF